MDEVWKPIKGYEKYHISQLGRVKIIGKFVKRKHKIVWREDKIKIIQYNNKGYGFIRLSNNFIEKSFLIHRLVAEAFIPNPNNYPIINHIDCNPKNNIFTNLEWCTYSYNSKYAYNFGKNTGTFLGMFGKDHPGSKPVLQFDLKGNFIREWENAKEVERILGIKSSNIYACAKGKKNYKTAGGFIWKYKSN
jgi:hypothetical protein